MPSLDNLNADILHQWEQSLAIKPAVLTTDLTLVPIYELVENEGKRLALRSGVTKNKCQINSNIVFLLFQVRTG